MNLSKLLLIAVFSVTSLHAAKPIRITGANAKNLVKGLSMAKAEQRQESGKLSWHISQVRCDYSPQGFIYSECQFVDNNARKDVYQAGALAFPLYSALVKAGALETIEPPTSSVFAAEVICNSESNEAGQATDSQCEIQD